MFTSFDKNPAEFFDNHILLTMIYFARIWVETTLCCITWNGNGFLNIVPLSYEIILVVLIAL